MITELNDSVIDHELLNKIIYNLGKITNSPSHLAWSFCLEVVSLGHIYSLSMTRAYFDCPHN